jgi:hypothetical protein
MPSQPTPTPPYDTLGISPAGAGPPADAVTSRAHGAGRRAPGSRRFRPTRRSLVERAARGSGDEARAALAELLSSYRAPLVCWIKRRLDLDDDQAEEAVHAYFGRVIKENLFARFDHERGRLRTFLCRSLLNDAVSQQRRVRREVSLDAVEHDGGALQNRDATADRSLDRAWARCLVARAKARVLAAHYDKSPAQKALFGELVCWIEGDAGGETAAEVGARLGKTANAVYLAAFALKGRLRAQIRAEVAGTLAHREDLNHELSTLLAALEEDET